MNPIRMLLRDLWFHLKRTRCILARRHMDVHEIGLLTKQGYRGIVVRQCHFCAEIMIDPGAAKKFGGK